MRQAIYKISIDGKDVSTAFDPVLISMSISFTDGGSTDRLELELNDTDGQIELPRTGAKISASLGWSDTGVTAAFEGFTDEPQSSGGQNVRHGHRGAILEGANADGPNVTSWGSRSKGRVLTITANSADLSGKIKQPMQAHADNMSFQDVAKQWGQKAGLANIVVSSALGSLQRSYWGIANESFMHWGARMAKELGATFKIFGDTAAFVPRSGGESASGKPLSTIRAVWGDNLLTWSIAPKLSRPDFKSFSVRMWDPIAAEWKNQTVAGSGGSSEVEHTDRFKAPAEDHAEQKAGSNSSESRRDRGGADSVVIDGEPAAQSEAPCIVAGIRPGVDGAYLIKDGVHLYQRGGGFTTQLTLKQPSGDAGTDDRGGEGGGGQ